MSEAELQNVGVEHAEAITTVLHKWLLKEIGSSMMSHNAVLDDWQQHQTDLEKPFENRDNTNTEKAKGHYNRTREWIAAADEFPDLVLEDSFLARQMFGTQMFISGAYRKQCFLQAKDATDYSRMRTDLGPTGIDLGTTISEAIEDTPRSNWPQLRAATVVANDTGLSVSKAVHKISLRDRGKERSDAVGLLKATQTRWTRLFTGYVLFAASIPDNSIADVPMYQPKSITRQTGLDYPFRNLAT